MPLGRSMQTTKQIGEYLVAAELCRRGWIAITFTGNVPEFDILAINEKGEAIPIQVKTIQGPSWQFDARSFLNIEIHGDLQKRTCKVSLPRPNLICIFVRLAGQGQDEFYVFRLEDLQEVIWIKYPKEWTRPRNPTSTHTAVRPEHVAKFKDNWKLLDSFTTGQGQERVARLTGTT